MHAHSEWEQAANEAKALQERWKEAGFASRKVNNTLSHVSALPAMKYSPAATSITVLYAKATTRP